MEIPVIVCICCAADLCLQMIKRRTELDKQFVIGSESRRGDAFLSYSCCLRILGEAVADAQIAAGLIYKIDALFESKAEFHFVFTFPGIAITFDVDHPGICAGSTSLRNSTIYQNN